MDRRAGLRLSGRQHSTVNVKAVHSFPAELGKQRGMRVEDPTAEALKGLGAEFNVLLDQRVEIAASSVSGSG